MKKIALNIFTALFFAICLLFSVGLLIPQSRLDDGVPMPKPTDGEGINNRFGTEFEEWFSKHFAFHHKVTDFYADIKLSLFGEGNDQVICGKDDFLFFADTEVDFIGSDLLSDDEINRIADKLLEMQQKAEKSGAKFLFVCAPNKNTVYPEMMPERYIQNKSPTDFDRLSRALSERKVSFTDLRETLREAKEETLLYHKRDTHWNGAGAELAVRLSAESLGFKMPDLSSRGPRTTENFEGDLDALLYPEKTMYDRDITYDFDGLYVYTSAFSTPMDLVITTRGGGEGKLLMFRDSFANAMLPYLASSFAETRMERGVPYNTSLFETYSPDYVIVEIAERNIRQLSEHIAD